MPVARNVDAEVYYVFVFTVARANDMQKGGDAAREA